MLLVFDQLLQLRFIVAGDEHAVTAQQGPTNERRLSLQQWQSRFDAEAFLYFGGQLSPGGATLIDQIFKGDGGEELLQ